MSEEKLFEEYMEEKPTGFSAFLKTPKGWLTAFGVLLAIVLAIFFYKSAVLDVMGKDEVKESVHLIIQDSLWYEKAVTPQEIKIVPAIRLKIKNTGKRALQYMDINVVFVFEETGVSFSDGMARALDEPLEPGETTDEILIKAIFGYSATSKEAFMKNKKEWKKAQAKIFVRAKGSALTRIGDIISVKQEIHGYDPKKMAVEEKPEEYTDLPTKELAHAIQVTSHTSQWFDKVATKKEVIIVPTITVNVKNVGKKPLKNIFFRGVFMYDDTGEILSEGLTSALSKALAPEQSSDAIEIKADFGYSATSLQAFYDNNSKWKRLKVKVYAKSKDSKFALLGTYPVQQKIKGVKVNYISQ